MAKLTKPKRDDLHAEICISKAAQGAAGECFSREECCGAIRSGGRRDGCGEEGGLEED